MWNRIIWIALFSVALLSSHKGLADEPTPKQQKILADLTSLNDEVITAYNATKPYSTSREDLTDKAKLERWIKTAKLCQDLVDDVVHAGLASGRQFDYDTHGTVGLTSPLPLVAYGRDICLPAQKRSEAILSNLK